VSVSTDSKSKSRTNSHIQFFGPDGTEVRCYAHNILVDGNSGSMVTKLALNDKPGIWRVQATDTVSGLSSYAFLDVK